MKDISLKKKGKDQAGVKLVLMQPENLYRVFTWNNETNYLKFHYEGPDKEIAEEVYNRIEID